jgi:hypothetical protein
MRKQLVPPAIAALAGLVVSLAVGVRSPYALAAFAFGAFALASNVREFVDGAAARRRADGLLSWGCRVLQRINTVDVSPYWFDDSAATFRLSAGPLRVSVPPLPSVFVRNPTSASPGLRLPFRV